jgi:hypothetical protein
VTWVALKSRADDDQGKLLTFSLPPQFLIITSKAPSFLSLRPSSDILDQYKPVGLLLQETENTELASEYIRTLLFNYFRGPIKAEVYSGLYSLTNGNVGLTISFLDALRHWAARI